MGFHVNTLLALHLRFIELKQNHVPAFLVFDQPSQVYFPERWPGDPDPDNPKSSMMSPEEIEEVKEIGEVHRAFRAMANAIKRSTALATLYIDGHVRAYHGLYRIGQTRVSRLKRVMRAEEDYWVHQAQGQPLLVVHESVDSSFHEALCNSVLGAADK